MCEFCETYYDTKDIPSLNFDLWQDMWPFEPSYDAYIKADNTPPQLIVCSWENDESTAHDEVQIPIWYCPICGRNL